MNIYALDVKNNNLGVYFSSEQLDLLSIVMCESHEELITFVKNCHQLDRVYKDYDSFLEQDLEQLKREVFKSYQATLVEHDSSKEEVLDNTLKHLDINKEDCDVIKLAFQDPNIDTIAYVKEYIKSKYPQKYTDIFTSAHRFISLERDQNKMPNLYDEFVMFKEQLSSFRTLLVGSGKPEVVTNVFSDDVTSKFDFYFVKRDLDFALHHNKHIRLHSLLTKGAAESLFVGMSKEQILKTLFEYVKAMIDFINEYNANNRLSDGTPVIEAIDLFNEIVSFDKNSQGEYENIWETKYGISIPELCQVFKYAKEHKPEGVKYLYNEPFLEDKERRTKVISVLKEINETSDHLIDTLGSQMHITFRTSDEAIIDCFKDFKTLQEEGLNIQITEFDLSLGEQDILKVLGGQVTYEDVYKLKKKKIDIITSIINNSNVQLDGLSYWSLTDNIDSNLERIRTNLLRKKIITDVHQIPTVCGGLITTGINVNDKKNTFIL